ncbi:MAG: heparinase II/III family protein [Deltaproteobacteria bacterium]|nr:heparinase II/III family protein [Deltaproteobacteria bacterium]
MKIGYYLKKAGTLPPHVAARRAAEIARREAGAWWRKWRDAVFPTYSEPLFSRPSGLYRCFRPVPLETLRPLGERIARLSGLYAAHRFDVLGSGWVEQKHGMACAGLEGRRFGSGRPVDADAEGRWLTGRINPPNLPHSRRIWRLVDEGHVPIDWHLDFKSGYRWPESVWYRNVPYGHLPGADIKVPRELARMHHLAQFAWAYALSRDGQAGFLPPETYAREFRNQVLDFAATNPPRFGVNWACTMDVAIRVANWLAAYDLFRAFGATFDEPFAAELARSAYDHGRFIAGNLEWFVDLRSNHYLADVGGLLFVAAYLPRTLETDAWLAFAVQELVKETAEQFHAEGSNFEASTCYHRLSAEIVLYSTALVLGLPEEKRKALEGYDHRCFSGQPGLAPAPVPLYPLAGGGPSVPFPRSHFERLERMGEFTIDATKPDGRVLQVGDNDSGRFLKLQPVHHPISVGLARKRYANLRDYDEMPGESLFLDEDHLDHRHLLAALNGLFGREDFASFAGDGWLETRIVQGLAGDLRLPSVRQPGAPRDAARMRTGSLDEWERMRTRWESLPQERRKILDIDIPGYGLLSGMTLAAYSDFGLYIFRSERLFLAIRCGTVGQNGNGGHAHNDQLSVALCVDGEDRILDPGTYLYTALPERRNEYRSVNAHFAPHAADGREPGRLDLGLFQLGDEAGAQCLHFGEEGFIGTHRGFGEPVYRVVELFLRGVRIVDITEAGVPLRAPGYAADGRPNCTEAPPFSPGYGVRRG